MWMKMKVSLVLPLEHLCCAKIVSPIFDEVLPLIEVGCLRTSKLSKNASPTMNMDPDIIYSRIYSKIVQKIKCLTPCIPLQKKMENFIEPLFCEIEEWLKMCRNSWQVYDDALLTILESVPRCWHSDGIIDREKSVKILIKNNDVNSSYRFVLACTFCLVDDVIDIWKTLPDIVKIYLKHHADLIVVHFIKWFGIKDKKDSRSFVEYTFLTPMWKKNVYIMKYVLKTLSTVKRSLYLTHALTQPEVTADVMHWGLSLMTSDEQQVIFKTCPVAVFRCITSWPLRSNFFDIVDILWPFLTEDTFCDILHMLLLQIKNRKRDDELLVIFQKFWAQSPLTFKNFANNNSLICQPLQFVLQHDLTEIFPRYKFSLYFDSYWYENWDIDFMTWSWIS